MGSMVNGGVVNGSGRGQGVHFKEMLALLVLITKGTEEEKHKCEWDIYGAIDLGDAMLSFFDLWNIRLFIGILLLF